MLRLARGFGHEKDGVAENAENAENAGFAGSGGSVTHAPRAMIKKKVAKSSY